MKKLFGFILFIFLMTTANCYAAKFNFLVIPNDLLLESKNDIIFQNSASLIGTDIINYYNQHPDMSAVPINKLKTYLDRPENYRLKKEVQKLITDYQKDYTVNYATVQKLASRFGTKQVLMINCNMDAQSYITRRTLWDALDIPGATVIDPAYRLTTQIALIDANNQTTLWQHNYQKLISSRESRILNATMGNTSEQLEKVQKYSTKFLSPQVVQETQLALLKMSPYQDLNLHPEIVKPNYVSIDKIKVDSKRGGVRSARYLKKESIKAGKEIKTGAIKVTRKSKEKLSGLKNDISNKVEQQKLLEERENALSTEEKIKQIQEYEQAKFELQKEKQKLKYEQQKQKAQLKEARRQAKMRAKLQLQEEKQKLLMQDAELQVEQGKDVQLKNEKSAPEIKDVKNVVETKKQEQNKVQNKEKAQKNTKKEKDFEKNINVAEPEVIPSSKIMQQDYKPVPYIRTKPILRERDYTINDY